MTKPSKPLVLHERKGAALWITINRPDARNSLNEEVVERIRDGIRLAQQDGSRAIVLTGAGERAFCAGADLQKNAEGSVFTVDYTNPTHYIVALLKDMEDCRIPIIARVQGAAVAGGFGLVCACDLAIASDTARFGTPETKVGISPMMIIPHMMRVLPARKLREMCFTGHLMTAQEALQYDVLNYVVPATELDDKVRWLIESIEAVSPTGIKLGKQALRAMRDMHMGPGLDYAQVMLPVMSSTPDAAEGMLAFQEKRAPRWPR